MSDYMDITSVKCMASWKVFCSQNGALYVTILVPHETVDISGILVLTSTPASNRQSRVNHNEMYTGRKVTYPFWLHMMVYWYPGVCMHNLYALAHATRYELGTVYEYAMKQFQDMQLFMAKYCVIGPDDPTMYAKLHDFICLVLKASYWQYVTSGYNLDNIWGLDVYFRTETAGMKPPIFEAKWIANWYNPGYHVYPEHWYWCYDLRSVGQQEIATQWGMEDYTVSAVKKRKLEYLQILLTSRQKPSPQIRMTHEQRKRELEKYGKIRL